MTHWLVALFWIAALLGSLSLWYGLIVLLGSQAVWVVVGLFVGVAAVAALGRGIC